MRFLQNNKMFNHKLEFETVGNEFATPGNEKDGHTPIKRSLEGQLFKYTNVVKGWQPRWFVIDADNGYLSYYEKEEHRDRLPARGVLQLAGSVISPSDEDSQTFSTNAANGDQYRVRASDARERQHWVNCLRAVAEHHTENLVHFKSQMNRDNFNVKLTDGDSSESIHSNTVITRSPHKSNDNARKQQPSPFKGVRDSINKIQIQANTFSSYIDELPQFNGHINSLDSDMLLLKATTLATINSLNSCLEILHKQNPIQPINHEAATIEWFGKGTVDESKNVTNGFPNHSTEDFIKHEKVDHSDDVLDAPRYSDSDSGDIEEQKSIILHQLSQLKLGMDLTKIVLPAFILEKRSLLEMFADCMSYPDMFLKITEQPDMTSRMLAVLKWYLTMFKTSRQGTLIKKPYNPVLGETFHCSWVVGDNSENFTKATNSKTGDSEISQGFRITYTAEQVSHHPPITAFHFQCLEKRISLTGSIQTKSKFMGMSVSVAFLGQLRLTLHDCDEEYQMSIPSAYVRSILTVPWMELGDRATLSCPKTGHSASVTFHTKPFYGGKPHKITGEVKDMSSEIKCRITGEWNGSVDFGYENGRSENLNTEELKVTPKSVRPLLVQGEAESRKLWNQVTEALEKSDYSLATNHKQIIEERQRKVEAHRKNRNTNFTPKYFVNKNGQWMYETN